ncbi:MAG: hypothetical protein ACJ75B_11540 [Flavisolibacter sp.]
MASPFELEKIEHPLELEEDIPLQSKAWRLRRIAWCMLFAFVIAAAVGFFGTGTISHKKITTGTDTLQYEHFLRNEAQTEIKIQTQPAAVTSVSIPLQYMKHFQLEKVFPETNQVFEANGMINYLFTAKGNYHIGFYLLPQTVGDVNGEIIINNKLYSFSQFIYP